MKVQNPELHKVYGKNTGRSEGMTLDESGIAHIQSVLTNLYSDPITAVIREYTTNAWDSMVEAGRGDIPIQVFVPTTRDPTFRVSDTGTGMSVDDIFSLYKVYGKSTKRESNEFTGQLGIGSKSALAYTNQFTLTTVHDGTKAVFSIHFNEQGVGTVTLLQTVATDAHNGVEIAIPVKQSDILNFRHAIGKFLRYVRSPYETSEYVADKVELEHVFGGVYFDTLGKYRESYIHMGNVSYPIEKNAVEDFPDVSLVVYVDIGDVQMTPNRESLLYNKRTKQVLREVAERYADEIFKNIESLAETDSKLERYFIGYGMQAVRNSRTLLDRLINTYLDDFQDHITTRYLRSDKSVSEDGFLPMSTNLRHAIVVTGGKKRGMLKKLDDMMKTNKCSVAYIVEESLARPEKDYLTADGRASKVVTIQDVLNRTNDDVYGWLHLDHRPVNSSTYNYKRTLYAKSDGREIIFTRKDLSDYSFRLQSLRRLDIPLRMWMVAVKDFRELKIPPVPEQIEKIVKETAIAEEFKRAVISDKAAEVLNKASLGNNYHLKKDLMHRVSIPEWERLVELSNAAPTHSTVIVNNVRRALGLGYSDELELYNDIPEVKEIVLLEKSLRKKHPSLFADFSQIVLELLVDRIKEEERVYNE